MRMTAPPEQEDGGAVFIRDGDEGPFTTPFDTAPPGEQVDDAVSSAIAQLVTAGWVCKSCKAINHISSDEGPPLVVQLRQTRAALAQAQAERDEWKASRDFQHEQIVKPLALERDDLQVANRALQSTLDSQVARVKELETALRKIAAPAGTSSTPAYWFQAIARAALSPIPSERDS